MYCCCWCNRIEVVCCRVAVSVVGGCESLSRCIRGGSCGDVGCDNGVDCSCCCVAISG